MKSYVYRVFIWTIMVYNFDSKTAYYNNAMGRFYITIKSYFQNPFSKDQRQTLLNVKNLNHLYSYQIT